MRALVCIWSPDNNTDEALDAINLGFSESCQLREALASNPATYGNYSHSGEIAIAPRK